MSDYLAIAVFNEILITYAIPKADKYHGTYDNLKTLCGEEIISNEWNRAIPLSSYGGKWPNPYCEECQIKWAEILYEIKKLRDSSSVG